VIPEEHDTISLSDELLKVGKKVTERSSLDSVAAVEVPVAGACRHEHVGGNEVETFVMPGISALWSEWAKPDSAPGAFDHQYAARRKPLTSVLVKALWGCRAGVVVVPELELTERADFVARAPRASS